MLRSHSIRPGLALSACLLCVSVASKAHAATSAGGMSAGGMSGGGMSAGGGAAATGGVLGRRAPSPQRTDSGHAPLLYAVSARLASSLGATSRTARSRHSRRAAMKPGMSESSLWRVTVKRMPGRFMGTAGKTQTQE